MLTRSMGLNHQVRMRLSSPATAMLARPTTPSLTASQRVRVTLWVQASRKVPVSSSRATSGAPQKMPSSAGDDERARRRDHLHPVVAGQERVVADAQSLARRAGGDVHVVEVHQMRAR